MEHDIITTERQYNPLEILEDMIYSYFTSKYVNYGPTSNTPVDIRNIGYEDFLRIYLIFLNTHGLVISEA